MFMYIVCLRRWSSPISYNQVLFRMHLPQDVYLWLLSLHVVPNTAEQDEKGTIALPPSLTATFDNGAAIADIIRKVAVNNGKPVPPALATIKADSSRSTRLTNWNFIWLALESIDLRMDGRIKELILQGQQALIIELVRQIFERDEHKPQQSSKVNIRIRPSVKAKQQNIDMKKLNLSKDPEDSETSLEFLMLLLKSSLGMNVEQILGLFTDQNKYLAQIIVKGLSDNFEPIILFYTLLIKHAKKLRFFYDQKGKDAEACLYALKPGFISKSEKVVTLAIELFAKIGNIYSWFSGQCSTTFFMGMKRHPTLKARFWTLFQAIIKDEEVDFFTKLYSKSFQSAVQQIQITTITIELLAGSELNDKLTSIGVVSNWLEVAMGLRQDDVEAQIISFRFIGELMLFMPEFIEQNEDSLRIFERKWYMKTLPEFATLLNELIVILEKLGEEHNSMASKIYQCLTIIAKNVGPGDKRDYLVQNFLPLVSKFPTIPTEYLIQHLKRTPLSHAEFLLVCECIEINNSTTTLISVGRFLKEIFLENPLLNFYVSPMLKEIIQKVIKDTEEGPSFIEKMMEEVVQLHSSLEIKYKSRSKHQAISFGKRDTSEKGSKQDQTELIIKQKWKQITLAFIMAIANAVIAQDSEDLNDLRESIKLKLLNSNNHIKVNSYKTGCKAIEETLAKKFSITKEQQHEIFEQYSKKAAAQLTDSMIRSHKPISQVTVASRLKGPENLTKQFQQITQKRKQEEEQRKIQELKKKAIQQKKRLSVKKELQITNLLRGQIGEAQLREEGFLERLIQQPKELQVVPASEIEERELQSIDITLKKYHKVLRQLFLTYTWTMYNGHSNQKFQDNQQRKEILTVVQLGKLLKDYRLAFLTNQTEVSGLVRDINIKLLSKREVNELDYSGFQQFVIQFCALIMTRNHTITITSNQGKATSSNSYKNEPLHVIVQEFFNYLKSVFIARGEKIAVFDDTAEIVMSKEQAQDVEAYTKKVEGRPDYILPKGFKKVSQNTIKYSHRISQNIAGIPEAYCVAIEIMQDILSQNPFNCHVIESISQKKTVIRVKPTALNPSGLQKQRAMSTYIDKPLKDKSFAKRRSSSRGIALGLPGVPQSQRNLKEQAAAVLDEIIEKLDAGKQKEQARNKRLQSVIKLQELEKSKQEAMAKKAKEKEEQKQALAQKEKEAEVKRRQQTERFLEDQKLKLAEKRRKNQQQQQKKLEEEEQKQSLRRENKERFKEFHQGQVEKIKKIEETALEKIRKERIQLEQSKEQKEEQRKRLKSQIEEEDKRIIELRKDTEKKIQGLFESEPIRKVFAKYNPNLKALFDFLVHNTFVSLTEKKHNNEVVFESWRQFLHNFEFTAFLLPKDTTLIFKNLTKGKLVSKDYFVGLTFVEFQHALLRICIKYKTIFNLIADKIKDNVNQTAQQAPEPNKQEKSKEKDHNEFQSINETTIKDILKENLAKDSAEEYGDVAQVTQKTLLGMIYYLKVPRSKQGQQKRFREILARKHPAFTHQTEWLKEKLNQEYTLQEPTKKITKSRILVENGQASQVSLN